MLLIFTKPIFHYAFVSYVGEDNARHFAFGKFEIFFSQREIFNLEKHNKLCIIIKQNPCQDTKW